MDVIESPRIDELRRRVQKDPTSIAFAQLAEEYRRVGAFQEAVSVALAGLAHHPSYLSARVTLGRALMELGQFGDARKELEAVIKVAPDNLGAIRALAEIHQRRVASRGAFDAYTAPGGDANEVAPAAPVGEASGAPLVELSEVQSLPAQVAAPAPDIPTSNPVIEELERWLAAIEADRAGQR